MGRQGRGAPPVALHLGHGQAPLKKKRAGARPKRAAAGVPLRESLAVFRWRTPADREIAVVAAILPSCRARGKGNPLSRTSAPRSFRKSGPFPAEKRGDGARPPSAYVPGTPAEILRGPARFSRGEARNRARSHGARTLSPTCDFSKEGTEFRTEHFIPCLRFCKLGALFPRRLKVHVNSIFEKMCT